MNNFKMVVPIRILLPLFFIFLLRVPLSSSTNSEKTLDINLMNLNIDEIMYQITNRKVRCVHLITYFLKRIQYYNPTLNAFITVDELGSLHRAKYLDHFYKKTGGKLKGRLHCVPTIVKDNIFVKGLPTTLGIELFSNASADTDAPVVSRLRNEGAIILGKANMIMFAAGLIDVASETGGLARNPYGMNYTVVGSSTGSAVALAARLAVVALGSDSGGSITAPASATGIVGFRPPSGSVDTRDVFPLLGQPFDTVGPMALNAKDICTVSDILQIGLNEKSTESDRPTIRIGILESLAYGTVNISFPLLDSSGYYITSIYSVDPEVQDCFRLFQQRLNLLSEKYNIITTVITEDIVELARPVLENEAHRWTCIVSDINRFLQSHPMRSSNGQIIANADDLSTHESTPVYYRSFFQFLTKSVHSCTASRQLYASHLTTVRRRLRRKIFDQNIDLVAMPTLNALPWPLGAGSNSSDDDPPSYGHLYDLAGLFALPALSLPLCFSKPRPGAPKGLPIGGYLMTLSERVKKMLKFAEIYEYAFKEAYMPLF